MNCCIKAYRVICDGVYEKLGNLFQGCETILYCSLAEEVAEESGRMYRFRKHWKKECDRLEKNYGSMCSTLWQLSEDLVQFKDYQGPKVNNNEEDSCSEYSITAL